MKILGLAQGGHDSSYAILEDGKIIIHEELERINRIKETNEDILNFYMEQRGSLDEFDYIVTFPHGNHIFYPEWFYKQLEQQNKKTLIVGHHVSHAANAFFSSDFESALIISIDGGGWDILDKTPVPFDAQHEYGYANGMYPGTFTIWYGEHNKITPIMYMVQPNLGGMWDGVTKGVFGLHGAGPPYGSQAGSVMGMAAYGGPSRYRTEHPTFPHHGVNIPLYTEQDRFDYAAAFQQWTEDTVRSAMEPYVRASRTKNICITGGVALNCMMNGKIKEWFNLENVFVPPVPYDAGLAMGCAQYLYHHILDHPRSYDESYKTPYLGKQYGLNDIEAALEANKDKVVFQQSSDEEVCDLLAAQNIISVYGGRSESGRRALGNRSILADPRQSTMRELINDKTKHRDWYRPLAPSILEEYVSEWFVEDIRSPYMSFAIPFKQPKKSEVPAVVHKDGTGRLQTVNKGMNPRYHSLLTTWYEKTGVPILLNTSFNDKEPIVETPTDAINCFLRTKIDFLYFTDCNLLVKKV